MCGIAGQINYLRGDPVAPATIRRMARAIAHRGPDDEGYMISGPIGFGFRRLSIIDLSGGHQPMSDEKESVWVIFNGEIFNFKELRTELESYGHKFRTRSDTEVIVHGYIQWGTDVFSHLNGMFGVAIWDAARRRLVIARDAMGIKLIYYRNQSGTLSFGSEIRAVTAADASAAEVNPIALSQFLQYRYTPSPLTIFKDVKKLAPGTMLLVENGECREKRWYDFKPEPFEARKTDEEAAAELLDLYRGAVRRHLLSDVPVGLLLSGGVDSGLLLGLMNENGRDWNSYTVGYGSAFADDELSDAAETATIFGSKHASVLLDQADFERALPKIVQLLEEPIASSSVVPMYFVCKRARQDVKVALIGQGPDELFGGYKRHLGIHYGRVWRRVPKSARSLIGTAINSLKRNETAKRGIYALGIENQLLRYQHTFSLAPAERIAGLFQKDLIPDGQTAGLVDYWRTLQPDMEHLDEIGGFQLLELRSSLPDELLMFADKISMAHGLEARVPYLDRTVVEYAQRLDSTFKIRNGQRKWLHRRVCQNYLPKEILRRKKRGFAVNVVDSWFQSSMQSNLSEILLNPSSLVYRLLDVQSVKSLVDHHRSKKQDNHKLLFSIVMFEYWLRGAQSPTPASFSSI